MIKNQILMNKPVYLGLSILDLSKAVMYQFYNDYMNPKYGGNTKIIYVDKDSFIVIKILQKMLKQDLKIKFWIRQTIAWRKK